MARFSEKELTLLKTFYLRQETALEEGLKVKKAQLYREVYEKPDMKSQTANTAFNLILQRFESLDVKEKNEYLKKWKIKAKEEEQDKKAEDLKILKAYTEGKDSEIKTFLAAKKEGIKKGVEEIRGRVRALEEECNFKTPDGRLAFKQMFGALMLTTLNEEMNNTYEGEKGNRIITNQTVVSALLRTLSDIIKVNEMQQEDVVEKFKKMMNDPVLSQYLNNMDKMKPLNEE